MREIYARASRTVVRLGSDPEVEDAFEWLNEDGVMRPHKAMSIFPSGLGLYESYCLGLLLKLPYFERVWVVQEAVVSSEVQVMCKLSTVSWDALVASAGVAPTYGRRHQNLLSITKARKDFKNRAYSLPSLLSLYRSFHATDPRDKIYAILGMVWPPSPEESRIVPYYAEATPSVYTSAAKSILKTSKNLDLFGSCSRSTSTQPEHSNVKTPSWVPNWIATGVASPFIEFSDPVEANDQLEVTRTFSATKESRSKPTFPEDHPQSVCLRGHFVDVVDTVGMAAQPEPEQFLPSENEGGFMSQLASEFTKALHYRCNQSLMFIEWEKITKARSRNQYVTGEDMLEVYWKTLAGGYFPVEDTGIWSKEKVAMEYTTSQDRYLSYLDFHHSYAA